MSSSHPFVVVVVVVVIVVSFLFRFLFMVFRSSHCWGITATPFLPVRQDFHPKRNQARQKLATLPKNRFKDLASDVYFELKRRWPEFEEAAVEVGGEGETQIPKEGKMRSRTDELVRWYDDQAESSRYYEKHSPAPAQAAPPITERLVPGPARRPSQIFAYPTLNPIKRHSAFPPVRTVR